MKSNNINILFTSSGRRVSLIRKFREAYQQYNINGKIITADLKSNAPTAFFSDHHFLVPKVNDPSYLEMILDICQKEDVKLVIPLIDTELLFLSKNKSLFEELGVKLLVSSNHLIEIASDKTKTYNFFIENKISTPKVYSNYELKEKNFTLPLLIKPLDGSSSKGVFKVESEKELLFLKDYVPNAMVQEFITGEEYTVDVMVDFYGNIKTIVPRLRIETRAGEVSKGVTKKDFGIIKAAERVVQLLPKPVGCITLQCFKKPNDEITFIEINARFGGGIPLSIEAGANFPLWVIEMSQGERFFHQDYSWQDNLTMLRYDDAVFTGKF